MPFVVAGLDDLHGRKRHRDDDETPAGNIYRLYCAEKHKPDVRVLNATRKTLPPCKKAKVDELLQFRRKWQQQQQQSLQQQQKPTQPQTKLSPCYICHRRPTKKSDLDSFAACQGCGGQTCFVCLRQCHGWTGNEPKQIDATVEQDERYGEDDHSWESGRHRSVVCSRCCVERGENGDVACLGCLSGC